MGLTIPLWVYPILFWAIIWTAIGAWRAARNNHLVWFVSFFVFNTIGILPIVYLAFFQDMNYNQKQAKKISKGKKRR